MIAYGQRGYSMSEERVQYGSTNLLQTLGKPDIMDVQPCADAEQIDWAHLERILVPVINYVRKAQGKRAVILPKG